MGLKIMKSMTQKLLPLFALLLCISTGFTDAMHGSYPFKNKDEACKFLNIASTDYANNKAINKAFVKIASKYHPDIFVNNGKSEDEVKAAEEFYKKANQAKDYLINKAYNNQPIFLPNEDTYEDILNRQKKEKLQTQQLNTYQKQSCALQALLGFLVNVPHGFGQTVWHKIGYNYTLPDLQIKNIWPVDIKIMDRPGNGLNSLAHHTYQLWQKFWIRDQDIAQNRKLLFDCKSPWYFAGAVAGSIVGEIPTIKRIFHNSTFQNNFKSVQIVSNLYKSAHDTYEWGKAYYHHADKYENSGLNLVKAMIGLNAFACLVNLVELQANNITANKIIGTLATIASKRVVWGALAGIYFKHICKYARYYLWNQNDSVWVASFKSATAGIILSAYTYASTVPKFCIGLACGMLAKKGYDKLYNLIAQRLRSTETNNPSLFPTHSNLPSTPNLPIFRNTADKLLIRYGDGT